MKSIKKLLASAILAGSYVITAVAGFMPIVSSSSPLTTSRSGMIRVGPRKNGGAQVILWMSEPGQQDVKLLLKELAEAAVDKDIYKAKEAKAEIWKSKIADKQSKRKSLSLYDSIPVPKQYEIVAQEIGNLGGAAMKELEKALQTPTLEGAGPGDLVLEEEKVSYKELEDEGLQPVWFATNRLLTDGDKYGNERSPQTTFGKAYVTLPTHHRIGETGRNVAQRFYDWCASWFKPAVDPPEVEFFYPFDQDKKKFFDNINEYVRQKGKPGRSTNALLFIHGYNNSFESAAKAAAQLKVDLKLRGPVAFFSWPSLNEKSGYFTDEVNERLSRDQIREFIVDFAKNCGCEKVHVLAHSMGNRALLDSIVRLSNDKPIDRELQLGQVIFAAADVDKEEFEDLGEKINESLPIDRKTLYAAHGDKALAISEYLRGRPRAGKYYPYVDVKKAKVELIAVPTYIEMEFFGHGYFREAESMLIDMHELILSPHLEAGEDRAVTVEACDENGKKVDGVWSIQKPRK